MTTIILVVGTPDLTPAQIRELFQSLGGTLTEGVYEMRRVGPYVPPISEVPPPTPAPPQPNAPLLAATQRIAQWVTAHEERVGTPLAAVEIFDGMVCRWYAGNPEGGTVGDCVVVDGPRGAAQIRNGFLAEWRKNAVRAQLGAPLEDEHGGDYPAVQEFERGRMTWSAEDGVRTR